MLIKFRLKNILLLSATLLTNFSFGQSLTPTLPSQSIPLNDLSFFQNTKKRNWKIAETVLSNRKIPGNLKSKEGKGILIFEPAKRNDQPLITKEEFGDLDLEFDFMLAKGSSFTVKFQNSYEVTISDLWLESGNETLKAPGLWQHLTVLFKAPTFDSNGKKITNARFDEILLNGQKLKKSTDAVAFNIFPAKDERATGPFTFVGKQGPWAVRNIRYKTYQKDKIQLSDISFKVYQGLHKNIDTLQKLTPKRTGTTDSISHRVGDRKSQLVLDGIIDIPRDGQYLFKITAGGGAWLFVDQKLVVENRGTRDFERAFYQTTSLKKGKYPVKIVYSNSDECLVLEYEGPQIPWHSLTTAASVRLSEHFEPLEYEVKHKPVLQRGFMMHRDIINPYPASVGLPGGNNYTYDMKNYNLLATWHGRFIDVSNMWRERGEKQMEIPLGAKLEFSNKPLIAKLANAQSPWPDSVQAPEGVFSTRGYKLNQSGLPVYFYQLNENSIEDVIYATKTNDGLTREVKITSTNPEQTYILLAEGKIIEKLPDGGYAVDDKNYYIENLEIGKGTAIIRQDRDLQQLLVPISTSNETVTIKYNIIW
jgi:hypothetical protein